MRQRKLAHFCFPEPAEEKKLSCIHFFIGKK